MTTQARTPVRSIKYDKSKWISDLKSLPVMDNDEVPANTVNFANRRVLDKVKQRFLKSRNAVAHGA